VFVVLFLVLSAMVGGTIYVIDQQVSNHFNNYLWKTYRHSTMTEGTNIETAVTAEVTTDMQDSTKTNTVTEPPTADASTSLGTASHGSKVNGLRRNQQTHHMSNPQHQHSNNMNANSMMSGGMFKEVQAPPPMGDNENHFISDLKLSIYQWSFYMLLVVIIASTLLSRHIVKPILSLNKVVKDISQGDLDTAVTVNRSDELGQLANSVKVMKESLQHNRTSRQAYLAAVAHELRTPLTILQANIEGMQDEVIETTPKQMGNLLEEVNRMSGIVNRLKKLTLMEAGQLEVQLESVNLALLLPQIMNKLTPLVEEKNLVLEHCIAENLPVIEADSDLIEQCIYNLIMNSIRYTDSGTITFRAKATAETVILSVTDTGMGIAEGDQPFIFDYFYRADKSRNKKSGGTGLGLAIVKQIVKTHHGDITVNSKLGKGSTFTIQLPLTQTSIISP